jgi:hypothetical protein
MWRRYVRDRQRRGKEATRAIEARESERFVRLTSVTAELGMYGESEGE